MKGRAFRKEMGSLTLELVISLAILGIILIPIAFSFVKEQKLLRIYQQRAAVMELVDGEMEILAAGEWRRFKPGKHPHSLEGLENKILPQGQLWLTIENERAVLEWVPAAKYAGGKVSREIRLPAGRRRAIEEKGADAN